MAVKMENGMPDQKSRLILNSLLVAAGLSTRMGKFKPLLLLKNEPIIISIINKLLPISNKIFIVTGFKEKEIITTIEEYFQKSGSDNKIVFVSNPGFKKGMFTSLQKGLKKGIDCDWLLYHFVDQPQLPQNFYSEFVSQTDEKFDWIQPAYKDKKGHPILIKKTLFESIIKADENSSLKKLIRVSNAHKIIWDCNYKEILYDIDTPEDYKELIRDIN